MPESRSERQFMAVERLRKEEECLLPVMAQHSLVKHADFIIKGMLHSEYVLHTAYTDDS